MECKVHSEVTPVYSESVTEMLVIADNNDAVMQDGYEGITQEMLNGSQQFRETVVCVDADQVTLSSPNSVSVADVQLVSPIDTRSSDIEHAMGILKIKELKLFQLRCLDALKDGKDVIVVQPTGSGKSVCFTLPAAGDDRYKIFWRVFQSTSNLPSLAFCTPEYLFSSSSNGTYSGTGGQFHLLLQKQDIINMVTIYEAHKVFDRLPDYDTDLHLMK